ncbi:MAG: serine protease [Candidatus Obscuribacterales bacterium]|nr:serine protease [Candidatus Obscuribacterales bacterium]
MPEEICKSYKSLDHSNVVDALLGKRLAFTDRLDCADTNLSRVWEEMKPKAVRVVVDKALGFATGSGVFVGADGDEVVTNYHVVSGSSQTRVVTSSGEIFNARILDVDDVRDLAHLKIEGISKKPERSVQFAETQPSVGSEFFAAGHPGGSPDMIVSQGIYFGKEPYLVAFSPAYQDRLISKAAGAIIKNPETENDIKDMLKSPKLRMSTPLYYGNSGGAVVDSKAKLVGIATAIEPGSGVSNIATPVEHVKELLDRREPKFDFQYERLSKFDVKPAVVLAGNSAALAVGYMTRRISAPLYGLVSAVRATDSFDYINAKNLEADRRPAYASLALQSTAAAGGVMSLWARSPVGRLAQMGRVGYALVGVGALGAAASDFMPGPSRLVGVTRHNKEAREPLQFSF